MKLGKVEVIIVIVKCNIDKMIGMCYGLNVLWAYIFGCLWKQSNRERILMIQEIATTGDRILSTAYD